MDKVTEKKFNDWEAIVDKCVAHNEVTLELEAAQAEMLLYLCMLMYNIDENLKVMRDLAVDKE